MYLNKTIGIVVPAHNEENLISRVITTIPGFVDYIVVVDDCSNDNTAQIATKFQLETPDRIILIEHTSNQGVGGAIASGYKWCRDHAVDVVAVMAGDAQMNPDDLPGLLDPVVNNVVDYAKGNRLFTGDAWGQIPKIRYMGNAALSMLTKISSGYWHIADSQCGYTAINSKALHTINWDEMHKKYGQPNDLLVRLNIFNFRVQDVPVQPIYGIGEKSGINPIFIIPHMLWLVSRLFIKRMWQKYVIRDFHPLIFFYVLAFALLMVSIPLTINLVWRWLITGNLSSINTLTLMFTAISGMQSLFFAMWFDMEYNKDLK